jgi:hypothetical protein
MAEVANVVVLEESGDVEVIVDGAILNVDGVLKQSVTGAPVSFLLKWILLHVFPHFPNHWIRISSVAALVVPLTPLPTEILTDQKVNDLDSAQRNMMTTDYLVEPA